MNPSEQKKCLTTVRRSVADVVVLRFVDGIRVDELVLRFRLESIQDFTEWYSVPFERIRALASRFEIVRLGPRRHNSALCLLLYVGTDGRDGIQFVGQILGLGSQFLGQSFRAVTFDVLEQFRLIIFSSNR